VAATTGQELNVNPEPLRLGVRRPLDDVIVAEPQA
jgi:hypothetical protein